MLVQIEAETLHFSVFGRELIEKLHPLSQFQFQLGGASVFGAFVIDVIEFFASPELLARSAGGDVYLEGGGRRA